MPFYTKRRSRGGLVCDPCYNVGCLSTCVRRIILWPDNFHACYLSKRPAVSAHLQARPNHRAEGRLQRFATRRPRTTAAVTFVLSYSFWRPRCSWRRCATLACASPSLVVRFGPTATRGRRAVCWFSCYWRGPMVCLKRHG